MFCYQCEQTSKGTGCTLAGVCGKDARTAALLDLLLYASRGLAQVAARARKAGISVVEAEHFVEEALFTTITNVNFDPERIAILIRRAASLRAALYDALSAKGKAPADLAGPARFSPGATTDDLVRQGEAIGIESRIRARDDVAVGLEELITYGLKGMAAYADHARVLGVEDEAVNAYFVDTLDWLATERTVEELTARALDVGRANLRAMEILDQANTSAYGHPVPTKVRVTPRKGKAILVSGHDLRDLHALLEQTEGLGIDVYTHGEMLPAHGYPGLRKFPHLAGNYGGAWQDQRKEFDAFPGAILMTTNCIQKPRETYQARIFTTGLVAWPGVVHVPDRRFGPVIEAALAAPGFAEDAPAHEITVGFGHEAVLGVAGAVVDAVKQGAIRHFFLIGGCDGAKSGRDYYTQLAESVPKDAVILTLACGKYRFNKLDFGEIGGIPRLLDIGQCNDAYSAIVIAGALAKAFGTDVNGLPLSLVLSWYEQKAVCILLTLLHLGIRNIRLGPTLPAFVKPPVLKVLSEGFGLMPVTTPEADLAAILG